MNGPLPPDFGWRYIGWAIWSNAITILSGLAGIFTVITLDPTLVSHNTFHYILLGNAILTVIVAQYKKNIPPTPPPTKVAP